MTAFTDALDQILDLVSKTNQHWQRCGGDLHNDREFWQDVMHGLDNSIWQQADLIYQALKIEHEEIVRHYPKMQEDFAEIMHTVKLGKPVVRPFRKGTNHHAFRAWMALKDCVNTITGTNPMNRPKVEDKPLFDLLFDE